MSTTFCNRCGRQAPRSLVQCPSCGAALDTGPRTEMLKVVDTESEVTRVPEHGGAPATLVVLRGETAGSRFSLHRERTSVGRDPTNDVFLDDITVSRRHCEVQLRRDHLELVDLGSLNGTYLNGARIESAPVAHGDEIQVGKFKLLMVGGARPPGDPASPAARDT